MCGTKSSTNATTSLVGSAGASAPSGSTTSASARTTRRDQAPSAGRFIASSGARRPRSDASACRG